MDWLSGACGEEGMGEGFVLVGEDGAEVDFDGVFGDVGDDCGVAEAEGFGEGLGAGVEGGEVEGDGGDGGGGHGAAAEAGFAGAEGNFELGAGSLAGEVTDDGFGPMAEGI